MLIYSVTDCFGTEDIIFNNTYIMWSFKIKYNYVQHIMKFFGTLLENHFYFEDSKQLMWFGYYLNFDTKIYSL